MPNALDGIGSSFGVVLDRSSGDGLAGAGVDGSRDVSDAGRLVDGTPPSRSIMRMGGSFEGRVVLRAVLAVGEAAEVDMDVVDGIAGLAVCGGCAAMVCPLPATVAAGGVVAEVAELAV